jgi:hypothetical protein
LKGGVNMKVQECLNSIPETNLGYIRMVAFVSGGEAVERTLDTYTNRELIDVQTKGAAAYYRIGEYWYVVYNA